MTPKELHAAMAKIVDAPGYPLLKDYRKDFEVLDKEMLDLSWHREGRALWFVRGMGTHIVHLRVHPKMCEEGRSLLDNGSPMECYLLTPKRVALIDRSRAKDELGIFDWSMEDGVIKRKGAPIAEISDFSVKYVQDPKSRLVADVRLDSFKDPMTLTHPELVGLVQYIQSEAVVRSQSLFCATRSLEMGGQDLYRLMDLKRAEWLAQEASQVRAKAAPALAL